MVEQLRGYRNGFVRSRPARKHGNASYGCVVKSSLSAIPFFGIPFNNTLPALAIIAACIAELEDDGLFVFVSIGLTIVTIAYFCLIFYALFHGLEFVFDALGVTMPRF